MSVDSGRARRIFGLIVAISMSFILTVGGLRAGLDTEKALRFGGGGGDGDGSASALVLVHGVVMLVVQLCFILWPTFSVLGVGEVWVCFLSDV